MNNNYTDTKTMMEFTEILKNEPQHAYDFICSNYHIFSKDKLADIIKELLYSLHHHVDNNFYGDLYNDILTDVQIELDETYDDEYQEYGLLIENINKKYQNKENLDMKQGDRVYINGDSAELWIEDYNVRVSTSATVEETPKKNAKKVLVTLDWIDGESNVCCKVRRNKIRSISK